VDRRELAELLAQLVAIDSVNPSLVAGGAGEGEIAAFVAGWLEGAGLDVSVREAAPGRPNVIATARGTGGGRSLVLNAHTDTVGVVGMADPHRPRVEGDRLYGRGAADMKAGLAGVMAAAAAAARQPLRGDVIVTAVADEEFASVGTEAVVRTASADAAVVAEPSGLEVCVAHKGFAWGEIETAGVAAHGSRPDLGVDGIARMGPVLTRLAALDGRLRAGGGHPLLGTGSVHASTIEGGRELSTYPDRCVLRLERRTVPGEAPTDVEAELRELAAGAGEARVTFHREPFAVAADEPIVQCVRKHAAVALGRKPRLTGEAGWMDAALLAAAGIPTVVFGPDGEGFHAVEEWADLASLERFAAALTAVVCDFCA
jgi:acetylornithine deacetylase